MLRLKLFLDRVVLRLIKIKFLRIKFKINFELKLTFFMLYLSLLTLRIYGHCCSMQCGMKPMNMPSRSENTVEAKNS